MAKTPKQTQRQPTPRDFRLAKSKFSGDLERIGYPYHHQPFEDVINILQDGINESKRKAVVSVEVIPTIEQIGLNLERETEKGKKYQAYDANRCRPLAKNKPPMEKIVARCPARIEE